MNIEEFTKRELFLMKQAFDAGRYYKDLDQWLNEDIDDAGHVVLDHLLYDADNILD